MGDIDLTNSALALILGGGGGGATAWAVLHTRLSAAEEKLRSLETSAGAKHEANADRIARLETTQAAAGATLAAVTGALGRLEASVERIGERVAALPNEVATMFGNLDNRPRRQ